MTRAIVGIALVGAALMIGARPAAAQDVSVRLSWGTSNVRVTGYYESDGYVAPGLRVVDYERDARYAPRRVVRRHYAECVADGPYLYCWDAPRYGYARPVVYVYVADRVARPRHPGRGRGWERSWERQHRKVAERHFRRWAKAHRYGYDRDRLIVDLAFAW